MNENSLCARGNWPFFFTIQFVESFLYFLTVCKIMVTNSKWIFSLVTRFNFYFSPPKLEVLEALLGCCKVSSDELFSIFSAVILTELQWAQAAQMSAWVGPNFLEMIDLNFSAGPNLRPNRRVRWSSVKRGSAEPSILCSRNTWNNKKKISLVVIRQFGRTWYVSALLTSSRYLVGNSSFGTYAISVIHFLK